MNAAAALAVGVAETLRSYTRAGLVLVPIPTGSKAPRGKGWNMRTRCWEVPSQIPDTYTGNVGLAHAYAGTCALDIDNATLAGHALAGFGIDLAALLTASNAVHIRSGRAGRDKLLFRIPEPLASINRSATEGFELRCAAGNGTTVQCVLPPSIHPDTGRPYQWQGDWRNLPDIPADLLTLWRHLVGRAPTPSSIVAQPKRHRRTLPNRIPKGERNQTLFSLACGLVQMGFDAQAVNDRLQQINAKRCDPPLGADEVDAIATRACAYGSEGFTMLPHKLLDSPEWKALPPASHDVVLAAFRRYNGHNNGDIALTWTDFAGREGFGKKDTFYSHRRRVVTTGILQRASEGRQSQSGRKPDLFAIAPQWLRKVSPVPKKEPCASPQKVHPYIDKQSLLRADILTDAVSKTSEGKR